MAAGVTVVESQTHDVVTIVSGVGVVVQLSDRNVCRFAVRVVICSSKTIHGGSLPEMLSSSPGSNKPKLLDQVREVIRRKHYSIRTEQAYCDWHVNASLTR